MAQDHKISTFGLLFCAIILTFGIVYLFSQQLILYYHYFKLKSVSYEDQELNGNIVLENYNTWFRKRIEINQKRIKTFKEVCQKYGPEIKVVYKLTWHTDQLTPCLFTLKVRQVSE